MSRLRFAGVVAIAALVVGGAATALVLSGDDLARMSVERNRVEVTVRVWDASVAKGYEKAFDAFERTNPEIDVKVDVVPFASYFDTLDDSLDSGTGDDIFWLNASGMGSHVQNGDLLDIGQVLGDTRRADWSPSVVDQFTTDGKLWGVPQLSDGGIALYYNKALVQAAGIDPATLDDLTWAPGGGDGDTLLPVLKELTVDANGNRASSAAFDGTPVQYGYNAGQDLQAIMLNYLGSNGAAFENADGTGFAFDTEEARAAYQYVVDLVNKEHVAPPASATNADGDFSRNQFVAGKMALFQSGLYSLPTIAQDASFDWGVVRMPAGPEGRVSVSNGIVASGNAHTKHVEATAKVLAWLGSADGARYIGADGAAVPAITAAQQAYYDHWEKKGVDVSPFFDVIDDSPTIDAPTAVYGLARPAFADTFDQMFAGQLPVAEALDRADDQATAALSDRH